MHIPDAPPTSHVDKKLDIYILERFITLSTPLDLLYIKTEGWRSEEIE